MAHKKGQGSSRNGRDSGGQRRGVKVYGGEAASGATFWCVRSAQDSIPEQRRVRRDFTLFALSHGIVKYDGVAKDRAEFSVYPPA
jgi:large subunit ribosomal protein L27